MKVHDLKPGDPIVNQHGDLATVASVVVLVEFEDGTAERFRTNDEVASAQVDKS